MELEGGFGGGRGGSDVVGETGKFDFRTSGRRGRIFSKDSGRRGWSRFLKVGEAGTGSDDDGRGRLVRASGVTQKPPQIHTFHFAIGFKQNDTTHKHKR